MNRSSQEIQKAPLSSSAFFTAPKGETHKPPVLHLKSRADISFKYCCLKKEGPKCIDSLVSFKLNAPVFGCPQRYFIMKRVWRDPYWLLPALCPQKSKTGSHLSPSDYPEALNIPTWFSAGAETVSIFWVTAQTGELLYLKQKNPTLRIPQFTPHLNISQCR